MRFAARGAVGRASILGMMVAATAACGGEPPTVKGPPTDSTATAAVPGAPVELGRLPPGARPVKPAGHLARVSCVAFSPDGRRVVSGSSDSTLLVWEVETGEIVQRLEGHSNFVTDCLFLPGDRIISGGWGGEAFVWDVASGKLLRKLGGLPIAHAVYTLALRADGREVTAGTYYGRVVSWNVDTGEETFTTDEMKGALNASCVRTVGYMSDGSRFAGGDVGHTVIWGKTPTTIEGSPVSGQALPGNKLALGLSARAIVSGPGGKVLRTFEDHQGWVYGVASSASGDKLIAVDEGGRGRVWGLTTGSVHCTLDGKAGYMAAAWSPSGDRIAVAGDDGYVRIGEAAGCTGGKALPLRNFGAPRGRIAAVAAGTSLLLGDSTGHVGKWTPGTWQLQKSYQVHAGAANSLLALPDGRWVSGGLDRKVFLGGQGQPQELATLSSQAAGFALLPGRKAILAGDDGGQVVTLNLDTGDTEELLTATNSIGAMGVEPGGGAAIIGGVWDTIIRMPLGKNGSRQEWPDSYKTVASTTAMTILPDGRYVHGGTSGEVLVRKRKAVLQRLTGLVQTVSALTATETNIWAGGSDRILARWKIDGPTEADLKIDEGARIWGLALVSDKQYIVAGLDDGSASVRTLPDGELVAHLYPFRDGSGATILADGRYYATEGAARSLRLEDPATRKVVTLGDLLEPHIAAPTATPLPDGSVAIRATVFSPTGPPTVSLDGGWTVDAVVPSSTEMMAYEVDLQLSDLKSGPHKLVAQTPDGASLEGKFEVLQDPRFGKTRALLIGNNAYQHRPALAGAAKDVTSMRSFLEGADGWKLSSDRIEARSDLNDKALREAITGFFSRATSDETLLFYFAGHGENDGDQGYLLPIDAPAGGRGTALSMGDFWNIVRESKAGRVVILLDAARAAAFSIPTWLAPRAKTVLLAATDPGGSKDYAGGGAFTRAFLASAAKEDSFDPDLRAATIGKVYSGAVEGASAQLPVMVGTGDILRLPLVWSKAAKVDRRTLGDGGGASDSGIRSASGELIAATHESGGAEVRERNGKLEIRVTFDRPTEAVKIAAYQPEDAYKKTPRKAPSPFRIASAPGGSWVEGKPATFALWDVKTDLGGIVEVRACSADGKKCSPAKLLTLPVPR